MSVLVFLYIRTHLLFFFFFFFNDTATTEIYTLSLHDALPISIWKLAVTAPPPGGDPGGRRQSLPPRGRPPRADRNSTRLNSSHSQISYAVFCLKKKKRNIRRYIPQVLRLRRQSQI